MSISNQQDVLPESSIPAANRSIPGAPHDSDQDRPDLDAFAAKLGMTEEAVTEHSTDAATHLTSSPTAGSTETDDSGPIAKVASALLHASDEDRARFREHRDDVVRNGRRVISTVLTQAANAVMSLSRSLDRAAEAVANEE